MCKYCLNWPAWPINQDTPEPKPELIAEPIRELEAEALREAVERLISEDGIRGTRGDHSHLPRHVCRLAGRWHK